MTRLRKPQLALIVLLLALAIGYGINALRSSGSAPGTARATAASTAPSTASSTASSTVGPPASASRGTLSSAASSAVRAEVPLSSLPAQVADTVALIRSNGPFPYSQDGVVFGNNEGYLPARPRGFYREYTVQTPGSADRGARRIITGADGQYYYTGDHYDSFFQVDTAR